MRRTRWIQAAIVSVQTVFALGACGTVSIHEENDRLGGGTSDGYYTQGTRISAMFARDAAPPPVEGVASAMPLYEAGKTTQLGAILGQEIYTPGNIEARKLLEDDRPYAGWLYAGLLIANATTGEDEDPAGDDVRTLEFDVGVVGPSSGAEDVQAFFHRVTNSDRPRGWKHQLEDELGVVMTYEIRNRLLAGGWDGGVGWDVLGKVSGSVGNVLTQGAAGVTGRLGFKLPRDFGVNTIHSTAVEVPDQRHEPFRTYLFAGCEGRAVARNIFLDGNTFEDSHSVDKEPFVGDLRSGLALEFGDFRLAYTLVCRSREFDEQDRAQRFGSISLSWTSRF